MMFCASCLYPELWQQYLLFLFHNKPELEYFCPVNVQRHSIAHIMVSKPGHLVITPGGKCCILEMFSFWNSAVNTTQTPRCSRSASMMHCKVVQQKIIKKQNMKFDSRFKAQESSGFFVPVIIQSKYFAETTVWIISLIALKKKTSS